MVIRKRDWSTFFSPQSVAVIGASRTPGKLGYDVLHNIIKSGFKGKIYPINPKSKTILDLPSYPSINDIPEKVDQAVFVIPAKYIPQTLEDCGKKGVGSAVIISSGFKEVGGEGALLEQQVKKIADKYNINVLGPNCLGLIDLGCDLDASFAAKIPGKGNIAFISQSGALGTAILDWSIKEGLGFSKFISLGNKADVNEVDLIDALCDDPNTKAILGYIEDVKNGQAFLEVAKKTTKKKPIIITKSGRTAAGARAASSHTGSLAGSDNAFDAAFTQSGVIRAEVVEHLFDYALAFSYQSLPKGNKLAVITNAGGPGIMATDAIENSLFISMASFEEKTITALKKELPAAASVYNPVDVMGDAPEQRYAKTIDIILKDKNVDGLLIILTPQSSSKIPQTAEVIVKANKGGKSKPILTAFLGGYMVEEGINILSQNNVPNYPFPERAVSAFNTMVRHSAWLKEKPGKVVSFKADVKKVKKLIETAEVTDGLVPEPVAREIAEAYGFRFPVSKLASTEQEVIDIANSIGYPLVMKIASDDISHKSDMGGVTVGLASEEEIKDEYNAMLTRIKKKMPKAKIDGVMLQEMVTGGQEVIIGVAHDPQFGPMLMFGLGGIYVEIMKDVTFKIAPLTDIDADQMIQKIKAYPLIKGARGHEGFDEDACKDAILRLSQLVTDFPDIVEMDINPLILLPKSKKGAVAIDIRMGVKK